MKRLDTPYDGKYYKFAFKNIETNEWFLANKKPKDITVRKGYFCSILADHYQYHIKTLMYDTDVKTNRSKGLTKVYTEYMFVCGMIQRSQKDIKEARKYVKDFNGHIQWEDNLEKAKKQKKFFQKRKLEIENSSEYLWAVLKD